MISRTAQHIHTYTQIATDKVCKVKPRKKAKTHRVVVTMGGLGSKNAYMVSIELLASESADVFVYGTIYKKNLHSH